ncbi:MAG: glutathione S-transferase family protein [Prochloraceae cyanobacterium]
MNAKTRLITIAVSHYCEKVRWALDWLNIEYVEESHAPPFHSFYTRRQGGSSVPVLVTSKSAYTDSTDILHYLDSKKPGKLYPTEPNMRTEVEQLEELFDRQLGVSTRCWAYYYTLDNLELVQNVWSRGVPWLEKIALKLLLNKVSDRIRNGYNITAEGAASSLEIIKQIFETVQQRLKRGNKYLVGDNFTAADLTFAALSAPIIRPQNHPVIFSQIRGFPDEMVAEIEQMRSTSAGKYALRLYREKRFCKDF